MINGIMGNSIIIYLSISNFVSRETLRISIEYLPVSSQVVQHIENEFFLI